MSIDQIFVLPANDYLSRHGNLLTVRKANWRLGLIFIIKYYGD